jgi:hypothetical protein
MCSLRINERMPIMAIEPIQVGKKKRGTRYKIGDGKHYFQ